MILADCIGAVMLLEDNETKGKALMEPRPDQV
jgi:hypothetical protein